MGQLVTSPLLALRFERGGLVIWTPAGELRPRRDADLMLGLLQACARPRTEAQLLARRSRRPQARVRAALRTLQRLGALVPAGTSAAADRRGWDWHDALFHAESRRVGAGQAEPRPSGPPAPAVRPPLAEDAVALPVELEVPSFSLHDVLAHRASVRTYGAGPLPLERLALLLGLAAQNTSGPAGVRGRAEDFVGRTYPSGGAAYSLELYPVIARHGVSAVKAGVYHYCPHQHALEPLSTRAADWSYYARRARVAASAARLPPVTLLVTSRYRRVRYQYRRIAYSLVLKEVGCLLQNLYLAATLLDLAPCALAAIDEGERLAAIAGYDPWDEPLVGELAVGPKRL